MTNDELLVYMKERFDQQDKRFDQQDKKFDELVALVKPVVEWKNRVQGTFEAARYLLGGGSILGVMSLIYFIFKLLTGKL
jgi:hypothetical protein